jgi:hypothetical protein
MKKPIVAVAVSVLLFASAAQDAKACVSAPDTPGLRSATILGQKRLPLDSGIVVALNNASGLSDAAILAGLKFSVSSNGSELEGTTRVLHHRDSPSLQPNKVFVQWSPAVTFVPGQDVNVAVRAPNDGLGPIERAAIFKVENVRLADGIDVSAKLESQAIEEVQDLDAPKRSCSALTPRGCDANGDLYTFPGRLKHRPLFRVAYNKPSEVLAPFVQLYANDQQGIYSTDQDGNAIIPVTKASPGETFCAEITAEDFTGKTSTSKACAIVNTPSPVSEAVTSATGCTQAGRGGYISVGLVALGLLVARRRRQN